MLTVLSKQGSWLFMSPVQGWGDSLILCGSLNADLNWEEKLQDQPDNFWIWVLHIWASAGTNLWAATCTHLRLIHFIHIFLGKVQRNYFFCMISLCSVCQCYTSILKAHLIKTSISILPSGSGHIELAHIKANPKSFKLNNLLNSTITNTLFSGTLLAWWKKIKSSSLKIDKKNLRSITKDEDQSVSARRSQRYISKYAEHFASAACGFRSCCLCFNAQFEVEEEK